MKYRVWFCIGKKEEEMIEEGEFDQIVERIAQRFKISVKKLKIYGEIDETGKFIYKVYFRRKEVGKIKPIL
jgi:hypothetical protein